MLRDSISSSLIRFKPWLLLAFCCAASFTGIRTAHADANTSGFYGVATVAPFKTPPVIDGTISPGEWDGALRTTGFLALKGPLDARNGTSYFGYTADKLYIAMVSAYPPDGKDHSSGTVRDRDYIGDEGVEVWLDPNRANRSANTGDLRYYQMNCNADGGIYDVSFDPKAGPDVGWNGHWDMKSTVDPVTHVWTMEMSLPWADLGWKPGEVFGKTLGVIISRNYKSPWVQGTWFPVDGAFIDSYRYAALTLLPDCPTVQITDLGENLHKGEVKLRATINNPGPARTAEVKAHVTSSDMPDDKDDKTIDLPANGSASYAFDVPAGLLHENASHTLDFDITSPDGTVTYLHYNTRWQAAPDKLWLYRLGPDPDAAVQFAFYPSYKFVRLQVDPRELGPNEENVIKSGTLSIAGPTGNQVVSQPFKLDALPYLKEYPVGDLPDGQYTLTVNLDGWKDPLVRTFTQQHFPWEGNTLGITDAVLPPFLPLQVKKGHIAIVERDYAESGIGLFDQITSAGKEILAAPMDLVADGNTVVQGKGKFTSTKPNSVVYEAASSLPAAEISSRVTTEEDGCSKVELTLTPGKTAKPMQSLWLDIPLKDSEAPLWHVSTTELRTNPAGFAPAGEGVVWDSRKYPDGNWYGNFKCYLWLGSAERGLCWFADNDKGWELAVDDKDPDNSVPCQELIRQNGVLTLRVNLIQKPVTLTGPRTIVFGLMASPGKPMPDGWRRVGITEESQFNMGYANPATFSAKAPWGEDWTIADWAYNLRRHMPGPSKTELTAWETRNFPADMDPDFRASSIHLAENNFLGNFGPHSKYVTMYFDEFHTTSQAHPESKVFQSEWDGNWYQPLVDHPKTSGDKFAGIGTGAIVSSYRDFACWCAAQWVKRGIGCYFDNAFPQRAYDTLTTDAYVLPNGMIQPSAGIWARREYLRRIWTIHHTMAPPDATPVMMVHMTNTMIMPYMVWDDQNLDLEWKYGPEPQQSKYPVDLLLAESTGRQTGSVPFVLARVSDAPTPAVKAIAERTKFGVMMVHEIKWFEQDTFRPLIDILTKFGYGQDDCKVYDYWVPGYPVTPSNPDAKSLLLECNGQLMLVVCTWNPQPETVTFKFDNALTGLKPTGATDAETGAALDFDGTALKLPLDGYGVRIVTMK